MNDLLARLPKAELHLHLEGTISAETLWAMAQANHVALPVGSLPELRRLYHFESFDKFIELWLAMCSCFRAEADYERMVDAFLAECGRQNIRYAEVHFTPYNHEKFGIGGRLSLEAVTRRLLASEAAGGPVVRIITDIPSESADASGPFTVALLEQEANPLVVALGLGGPEAGHPRARFSRWFDRARSAGYPAVAHAGETGGAEHVRQAVLDLQVRRVQHGVRAVEDPEVLRLLAARGIWRRMMAAGVPVTLSTDDPPFFGTDLLREWERAQGELDLNVAELWELNLNGLRYGLADTALRRKLLREFETAGRGFGL